jgi:ABC-type branched-subunit amino acid transport system ATPase component
VTALLRTEAVSKAFGGVQALNEASIEVGRGEIAGLIGPNGSGKTTLFNVITGYERADAGHVYLNDVRITNARPERVFALGVGRTFQLTRIFPRLTVLENMLVAVQHTSSAQETVDEAAQDAAEQTEQDTEGATRQRERRPRRRIRLPLARAGSQAERRRAMELLEFTGIATHSGALAETLSYGQRKLLELAYVLVADPEIVLLDEPAGGVNPTLIKHIAQRVRELNAAGKTFLIVEHNMDFVMDLCDSITVLDYGSVIASGTPERVRNDPRVLDAYLGADDDEDDEEAGSSSADVK